ncbi:MAG: rhomboid family intramembrane serine protease [Bacteroidales bacterium]|nr:rhomboid family intramembrane serine protease [Bacteroidales bacterium]
MNEQYSPTGFRVLPPVVKHLLIINALMYLATFTLSRFNIDLTNILGLHFFKASDFRPYQLITYMFMHGSFGHLFFNMFALWMFGNTLENLWGSQRFLLFYMVCGIGAGLCQELVQYIEFAVRLSDYATVNTGSQIIPMATYLNMMNTVGASGAIYGLLLAFGMMFPNSMIYLYFLFPIKAKWFVIGYAVIELITGLRGVDNVAHFAHLGGMLFGLLLILYWRKKGLQGPNFDLKKWKGWFWSQKEKMRKNRVKYTPYEEVKEEVPRNDGEYNRQRAEKERNIDEILDKIAKSGYDSLTPEEKEYLFKNSK